MFDLNKNIEKFIYCYYNYNNNNEYEFSDTFRWY